MKALSIDMETLSINTEASSIDMEALKIKAVVLSINTEVLKIKAEASSFQLNRNIFYFIDILFVLISYFID